MPPAVAGAGKNAEWMWDRISACDTKELLDLAVVDFESDVFERESYTIDPDVKSRFDYLIKLRERFILGAKK